MNKARISKLVAEKLMMHDDEVMLVFNSILEEIEQSIEDGNKVSLTGFGVFEVRNRAERMSRNIKTGETVLVEASKCPVFRASKAFKNRINK